MNIEKILSMVDHTLLKQESTWEQIKSLCDDAIKYNTASVCIPPSFVKQAKEYMIEQGADIAICTVIGFPNGYNTTNVKWFETKDAVINGADEIDMVINIGWVKDGRYEDILNEIDKVKEACDGRLLKVIIETCLLTDEEKVKMCEVVSNSKADYIKTSTGFSTGGATVADIKLLKRTVKNSLLIKASGGVKIHEDMVKMIKAGANRIGTSRGVALIKE